MTISVDLGGSAFARGTRTNLKMVKSNEHRIEIKMMMQEYNKIYKIIT